MVIQRWQSVLLLATAVVMACFTFFSLGQIQLPEQTLNFTTMGFEIEGASTDGAPSGYALHTWGFFVVSLLSFVIPFINIFMFKNLKLQKSLCVIEILFLFTLAAIGCTYGYYHFAEASVSWSSLICALPIAIIADLLAYQRICADQRTLRAADRLR
ncbi:MAG: DUF4293 domain-containing protein [Muribaculaceae bacterium]|nr:DUF4293 domain-containing protein [Muribaculaceae bacterium]